MSQDTFFDNIPVTVVFFFRTFKKSAGTAAFPCGSDTAFYCKNVFFFRCNGSAAGFIQKLWYRFFYWALCFHYDELYGNHFLYHEHLLYACPNQKNKIYSLWRFICHAMRDCRKHFSGIAYDIRNRASYITNKREYVNAPSRLFVIILLRENPEASDS